MPRQDSLSLGDEPGWPEIEGLRLLRGHLDGAAQRQVLDAVMAAIGEDGWYAPTMPGTGRPFSVRMANLGPLGWVADRTGYRYQAHHPQTGAPWPAIPPAVSALWDELATWPHPLQCCLVNHYEAGARMGLHQDRDEAAQEAPVLSVSLGASARFRIGGTTRRAASTAVTLLSGDVVVLGEAARRCFHGIDRILDGTSDLVPGGGRINLTLRRVTIPDAG